MKSCPFCRNENEDDHLFCQKCGKSLLTPAKGESGETVHANVNWQQIATAGHGVRRSINVDSLFSGRQRILIGRSPEADIYLPHSTISRFHAELEKRPNGLMIRDTHSVNGVSLNGRPIQEATLLKDQDRVGIGPFMFHLEGTRLEILDNSRSLRLQARNLEKIVRDPAGNPKKLLDNISLAIEPGEFVSLLGPSGSGKSTLMDCLNGRRPASGGLLLANGENFYQHYNSFRQSLGYVPQRDIVHSELTVYRALYYTALLRLPTDTDKKELTTRIEEVLDQMELVPHQNTLIHNLSGGQIKRVSLGAELIARPCLLFIDEATSGLDAGTEARMMRMFRHLANEGKSIICITHNVDNVDLCNLILILMRGKLAYYGPPGEALVYFNVHRISEIYDKLHTKEATVWERDYFESPLFQVFVQKRLAATDRMEEWEFEEEESKHGGVFTPLLKAVSPMTSLKPPHLPHTSQFLVLLRRNLELLWRDRSTLRLLVLQAPLVALFILLGFSQMNYGNKVLAPRMINDSERAGLELFQKTVRSAYEANKDKIEPLDPLKKISAYNQMLEDALKSKSPFIPEAFIVNPMPTYILLFLLVIIVLWFGCNNAAKEIVKEEAIYKRERAVNLGILPYLSSKFIVLSFITALQTLLLMAIVYGYFEVLKFLFGKETPFAAYRLDYLPQYGILVLLAMTGVSLGLFLSALVRNPDQANTLLPYVLIPQVILGGGMLPVKSGLLLWIAMLVSPAYWAFRAVRTGESELPVDFPVRMTYDDSLWIPCLILAAQTILLLLLTIWALRQKDTKRE